MKPVLIIEDDKKKIGDIKDYLSGQKMENVVIKESYQSGLRELLANSDKYALLLLDMSLPTWDKSPNELSGHFEKFGGYNILKELVRKKKQLPTILMTMFDNFGESDNSIDLKEINRILSSEFSEFYKGVVYYNSRENKWRDELRHLLDKIELK